MWMIETSSHWELRFKSVSFWIYQILNVIWWTMTFWAAKYNCTPCLRFFGTLSHRKKVWASIKSEKLAIRYLQLFNKAFNEELFRRDNSLRNHNDTLIRIQMMIENGNFSFRRNSQSWLKTIHARADFTERLAVKIKPTQDRFQLHF